MVRTRFGPKDCMLFSVKGLFEINDVIVQVLPMLEVLHRILRLKIFSVALLPALN